MPTLVTSQTVVSSALDNVTLVASAFTPQVGDVIVVKSATESSTIAMADPTDTAGNTYTRYGVDATGSHCWAALYATVAGSATSTVVSQGLSTQSWHSMAVELWRSAALDASPAVNSTELGTGAPSTTLTTTQPLSVVSWLDADWAAQAPGSRVYNTTSALVTETGIHDKSPSQYVAYYAWQNAASAGSQTFGLTTPTGQTWTLLGIEVLDVPGPGAPEDPDQAAPLVLWQ